jgi:hypothetical protein
MLMIAYVFPPIAYAGTFRTLRLCKYLSRQGLKLNVLTIEEQKDLDNDHDLLKAVPDDIKVWRTRTFDPWRVYQKNYDKWGTSIYARLVKKIAALLLYVVNQPDHMIFWVPFAVIKGYRLIKENKIPVIYTSSPPHSSHLIGYWLKRITRVKWIVDLRDPIVDDLDAYAWSKFEKWVNMRLENRVVKDADAIIVNTEAVKKSLKRRYRAQNIKVIMNSYDEEDFKDLPNQLYSKFTILHLGSMYGSRKADLILQAVKALADTKKIDPSWFRLFFIGLNDDLLEDEIKKNGLAPYIVVKRMLPHREGLEIMSKSHLLLLVKEFSEKSENQIPGKLFEYLGARKKILYVGPEDCEAAEIVRYTDSGYVVGSEVDRLSQVIFGEYQEFMRKSNGKGFSYERTADSVRCFNSEMMARSVKQVFLELQ